MTTTNAEYYHPPILYHEKAAARVDPVLQPYLQFAGEQSERCLCALLDGSTDGTIRTIVARTLCGGARGRHAHAIETDDVRADVVLQLLGRPRRFRRHRNPRRDSS